MMTSTTMERILIVEDMPDNLLVLQATLKHEGYDVLTAMNGETAIELLKKEQPEVDLVLSDVMMPGLSGYDLCRCLRNDPTLAHLPIVLITAKRLDEQDALLGMDAGADDYLIRPIDPQLLSRKLRLLLDRKRDLKRWQKKYQHKMEEIESREWGTRMLVHDIRNPLTGAMAAISLLEIEPNITEEQHCLIKTALACLSKQRDMLQDILLTAAAQNGRLSLNKRAFDMGVCVKEQVELQKGVAAMEHLNFHCQGLDTGFLITADKQLIGRVVANLILNAIKYGRDDTKVEIWLGPPEECPLPIIGKGRLVFVIVNQGPSVPQEVQQKIFQPFMRGGVVRKESKDSMLTTGVGLGLCFCLKVIELHGGFINLISPLPGRMDGVAFYFLLP